MNIFLKIWSMSLLLTLMNHAIQAQTYVKADFSSQGIGLGLLRGKLDPDQGTMWGVSLGVESPLFDKNEEGQHTFRMAPRASIEYHSYFIGYRATALYYTDFERGSLVFRPEIGLSLDGRIYLLYGRNIAIKESIVHPTKNQITIGINFLKN